MDYSRIHTHWRSPDHCGNQTMEQ